MKNILCVKWGNKYDGYEEKLKEQVEKNCSYDFKFYCLTDKPEKKYHIKIPLLWDSYYNPKTNHFWAYRKTYMFRESLFKKLDGDEFLFFDLDVLIHGSIDYFWELPMEKPWIIKGWWNDIGVCKRNYNQGISPMINSSVIRWNRNQLYNVHMDIDRNLDFTFFTYKTLDNYLNRNWYDIDQDQSKMFNFFPKGKIYSWYKGNIFPDDMETNVLRKDHIVCLFNNNTIEDDRAIEKLWKQNV